MSTSRYLRAAAVVSIAAAFAGARVAGETAPAFQAAAHLFVGGLVVYAATHWTGRWWQVWRWPLAGVMALTLSLIELSAFFFLPKGTPP